MILAPLLIAAAPMPNFAQRLWNALPASSGNVVVSPTSVEACLGLLIPGVGPSSRPPLAQTLGTSAAGLDAFQVDLQKRLRDLGEGDEATISNAAFFAATPIPAYASAVEKGYGAKVERLQPGEAGLRQVNGWVDKSTKGRIPHLFGRLNPSTHAVLVNAVTFDGSWLRDFPERATAKAPFQTPLGPKSVDLMHQARLQAAYGQGAGFQAVELPYRGGRYAMTILLPDAGDPARILESGSWQDLKMARKTVDLFLPRFTVRSEPSVETALKAMGLAPLFAKIDLSRALAGGHHDQIDQIVHKTYMKVDEKGTEAAAATGIAITKGIVMPDRTILFRVDRPFALAIRRAGSGEILFQGVIRNPAE